MSDSIRSGQGTAGFCPRPAALVSRFDRGRTSRFLCRVSYGVRDASSKAQQLLEQFELDWKCHTAASDLSRGMRQKLAICCAFLHDPQVILLDEPLTGLDPRGIRRYKEALWERAAGGAAIVVSSHLLAMVEDVCTHVMILDNSIQRFFGSLEQLREVFDSQDGSASLETIFFAATQGRIYR